MKKIPYGKYTKEFRLETVKLVIDGGLSIPEAGRRLSLAPLPFLRQVFNVSSSKLLCMAEP